MRQLYNHEQKVIVMAEVTVRQERFRHPSRTADFGCFAQRAIPHVVEAVLNQILEHFVDWGSICTFKKESNFVSTQQKDVLGTYSIWGVVRKMGPPNSWGYWIARKKYKWPTTMPTSSIIPLLNTGWNKYLIIKLNVNVSFGPASNNQVESKQNPRKELGFELGPKPKVYL